MDDLQTIRDLKAEAEKNRLKPGKHDIGQLRESIESGIARNKRMLVFIDRILSADEKVTRSQLIEAFLRSSIRIIGEEALAENTSVGS